MKKLIISLIIFGLIVGAGIWVYNSGDDENKNPESNYKAERSGTSINLDNNSNINNNKENKNTTEQNNTNSNENSVEQHTEQPKTETELSSFSTKIHNKDSERQNNISITCKSLTNSEIKPGETFSFCDIVGKSTTSKGYEKADVYVEGKKKQGLGGGNCQVSTTLYNAVLKIPELEVVERHKHSGKVPYIEKGKDAAVSYGAYDFKFKNNTDNTIKIIMESDANNVTAKLFKIS